MQQFKSRSANTYIREEDAARTREFLLDQFRRESAALCPNEAELCDILIDLCYCDNRSKQFVWDLCGHVILRNLLQKNWWYHPLSGCGCSGSVVCSYILSRLKQGELKRVAFFVGHRRIDERSICKTGRNNPRHCAWRAVDQRVTG